MKQRLPLLAILLFFFHINISSQIIYQVEPVMEYDAINSFSDGIAVAINYENYGIVMKYGAINKKGILIIPIIYDNMKPFSEGLAAVEKNDKWGFIDKAGNIVIPLIYDEAHPFSEGLASVGNKFNHGYIDKSGNVVVPLIYDVAFSFSEGLAAVEKNGKWGFIDKLGNVVVPFIYRFAYEFSEGLACVNVPGAYGFIDRTGREVIPPIYEGITLFSEGLAGVKKNGKTGFINKSGKVVIPFDYDFHEVFQEGLAAVKKNDKWGFINKSGKVVIPFDYGFFKAFNEGLLEVVKVNGKKGYIDKAGKTVIPIIFDDVCPFSEGLAPVKLNGKWGIIKNPLLQPKGNISITWQTPSPYKISEGKIVSDKANVPISLFIKSSVRLDKRDFKLYINGKTGSKFSERDISSSGKIYEYRDIIRLSSPRTYTVQLKVEKAGRVLAVSEVMELQYASRNLNLHLLSIGTNPADLQYTGNDATDIYNLFKNQKLYNNIKRFKLIGTDASKGRIMSEISRIKTLYRRGDLTNSDMVIIFISSHGAEYQGEFIIQANDFEKYAPQYGSITMREIAKELNEVNCKKVLFLDACKSGGAETKQFAQGAKDAGYNDFQKAYEKLLNPTEGWLVFTSSDKDELSQEDSAWRNGSFTEAIIEGLKYGKADANRNNLISFNELYNYLKRRVPQLNRQQDRSVQNPQVKYPVDMQLDMNLEFYEVR